MINKFYAARIPDAWVICYITVKLIPTIGPNGMYCIMNQRGIFGKLPEDMIGTHMTREEFEDNSFDILDQAKDHLVSLLKKEREDLQWRVNVLTATIHVLKDEEE